MSAPAAGRLRTAPSNARTITFAWSGDEAGQGWGINPDIGRHADLRGDARRPSPDFFIHSGDNLRRRPDPGRGQAPRRHDLEEPVTEAKAKVAETLDEFRGNFALQPARREHARFNAEVPMLIQWDDHEVHNNWYPGQILADDRYTEERVAARRPGRRAMFEYTPIAARRRRPPSGSTARSATARCWTSSARHAHLSRSEHAEPPDRPRPRAAFLGPEQLRWLKRALRDSTARPGRSSPATCRSASWSRTAPDEPEAPSRPGPTATPAAAGPRARARRAAPRSSSATRISNVVWLTADVHYAAAHHYDPARAAFTDFDPFWEFVAGPLNAGTFGPGQIWTAPSGRTCRYRACPGHEAEPPASRGHAVLRGGPHRRRHRGHDRVAASTSRAGRSSRPT